jgi:N-acetylmuramoyl-L-alanine amidase
VAAVSDVRYWATPGYSRVVVDVEERVNYEVGRLTSPTRLFVDLQNTKVSPPKGMTLAVDDDLLKRVRVAQFKTDVSRVVLDLGEMDTYEVFELTNPYRLVIDVHGANRPAVAASATPPALAGATATAAAVPAPKPAEQPKAAPAPRPPAPRAQTPGQAKQPVKEAPPAETAKAAPAKPTQAPTEVAKATPAAAPDPIKPAQAIRGGPHSLTRALGLKIGRILLDPGHGGHDTGTIGPSGLTEKELTLDLAQRVGKLIEERLGSEVAYTREQDTFVPLEERAALANQMAADLFLSIHANSSRIKRAAGVETYYLSLTTDRESLDVAARENAVSQETISQLQGLVEKIALNEKVDESKEFAARVQSSLGKTLANGKAGQLNRGVKKAPFVVLIGANMPSVLTEVSFLSNPEEEKRLKTPEYRQKIAEALYRGIESYVGTMSGVKVAKSGEPTQTASAE